MLYRLLRKLELFFGYLLGTLLFLFRFRYRIIKDNFELAYPGEQKKIKRLIFANYIHYGRLFFEILHLPMDASSFAKRNVKVKGYENFEKAFKKGKGVFFLSAHLGYWEVMAVMASEYRVPLHVLTKFLRIKFLDDIWVNSRQKVGIKLINERFSAKEVLKAIKNKEVVGFVLDQFSGPPIGRRLNFFNKPAWTVVSLAWFVEKTGAVVVPVVNYRNNDGSFDLIIEPELDYQKIGGQEENIVHNTQRYNDVVEELIKRKPEQWLWLHKRWKRVREDDLI